MFRNPQDLQNLKLSLKFNFEQDFMEKNGKKYATNEMLGTVYQIEYPIYNQKHQGLSKSNQIRPTQSASQYLLDRVHNLVYEGALIV